MWRRRLLALCLLSLLPASAGAERYQPEVATGDVETLDAARLEIQKSIAVGGSSLEQVVAWRYDWAYLNWRIAQTLRGNDDKRRKALLKEAERQLDLVIEGDEESAEAWALRGSAIGDRITGGVSGTLLGRKASSSHRRAVELDGENPRAALLRGVGLYYTPKTFGGGRAAAEDELRRAVELFDGRPEGEEWPSWGHDDALAWLGVVLVDRDGAHEARALYERALELRPDNAWIRDELLPALDAD